MELPTNGPIPGGETDVLSAQAFNETYNGTPPWDIGKPQPVFLKLAEVGAITGAVLDCGCGTGELSLALAERDLRVLGIDAAPLAIEKAWAKAKANDSAAEFQVADALHLELLGRQFDTILDSGLFHCFSDKNRQLYVHSLSQALKPRGTLLLMCFSENEKRPGPRRVTQAEIYSAFARDWTVNYIKPARFESLMHEGGAEAWLASIVYTGKV